MKTQRTADLIPEPATYSQREKEIVQSKMDEVSFFFKKNNREPEALSKNMIERIMYFRLKALRNRPNAKLFLNDPHNLLQP